MRRNRSLRTLTSGYTESSQSGDSTDIFSSTSSSMGISTDQNSENVDSEKYPNFKSFYHGNSQSSDSLVSSAQCDSIFSSFSSSESLDKISPAVYNPSMPSYIPKTTDSGSFVQNEQKICDKEKPPINFRHPIIPQKGEKGSLISFMFRNQLNPSISSELSSSSSNDSSQDPNFNCSQKKYVKPMKSSISKYPVEHIQEVQPHKEETIISDESQRTSDNSQPSFICNPTNTCNVEYFSHAQPFTIKSSCTNQEVVLPQRFLKSWHERLAKMSQLQQATIYQASKSKTKKFYTCDICKSRQDISNMDRSNKREKVHEMPDSVENQTDKMAATQESPFTKGNSETMAVSTGKTNNSTLKPALKVRNLFHKIYEHRKLDMKKRGKDIAEQYQYVQMDPVKEEIHQIEYDTKTLTKPYNLPQERRLVKQSNFSTSVSSDSSTDTSQCDKISLKQNHSEQTGDTSKLDSKKYAKQVSKKIPCIIIGHSPSHTAKDQSFDFSDSLEVTKILSEEKFNAIDSDTSKEGENNMHFNKSFLDLPKVELEERSSSLSSLSLSSSPRSSPNILSPVTVIEMEHLDNQAEENVECDEMVETYLSNEHNEQVFRSRFNSHSSRSPLNSGEFFTATQSFSDSFESNNKFDNEITSHENMKSGHGKSFDTEKENYPVFDTIPDVHPINKVQSQTTRQKAFTRQYSVDLYHSGGDELSLPKMQQKNVDIQADIDVLPPIIKFTSVKDIIELLKTRNDDNFYLASDKSTQWEELGPNTGYATRMSKGLWDTCKICREKSMTKYNETKTKTKDSETKFKNMVTKNIKEGTFRKKNAYVLHKDVEKTHDEQFLEKSQTGTAGNEKLLKILIKDWNKTQNKMNTNFQTCPYSEDTGAMADRNKFKTTACQTSFKYLNNDQSTQTEIFWMPYHNKYLISAQDMETSDKYAVPSNVSSGYSQLSDTIDRLQKKIQQIRLKWDLNTSSPD